MDRQTQIEEIIDFVKKHKSSHASRTVCARILGDSFMGINDDAIDELRARLPRAASDELEACYYIIK
ncbi:MAG: hypothetical protein PWQ97_1545 [Tepidanaerobacteraceae bacterium]|nr:hypothetical protein [Tepidanaerobacteraceae bacterium]